MSNVLGIDEKHEANLRKLAAYLWLLPNSAFSKEHRFDMRMFAEGDDAEQEFQTTCGSVGCAVGHGPYAGIPKKSAEDWFSYQRRVFGAGSGQWVTFFSLGWVSVDNTPRGAARRILYSLANEDETLSHRGRAAFFEKYKKYRPKPEEFGRLSPTVLKRLGVTEQPCDGKK